MLEATTGIDIIKRLLIAILAMLIASSLPLAVANAQSATDSAKTTYNAAMDRAAADYKAAREKMQFTGWKRQESLRGSEAEAGEARAKAEAEAAYKNTPKAAASARKDIADADYKVAEAKCGSKSGNSKDVCIKEKRRLPKSLRPPMPMRTRRLRRRVRMPRKTSRMPTTTLR